VAAGLVAGLLVTLVWPSTYRASGAVVLVRQGRPPGADPELARAVVAAEQLLRSRAVADSVVANLKLEQSPEDLLDDLRVSAKPEASLVRFSVDAGDGEDARRRSQELAEVFTVLYNGRFGPETTAAVWEVPQVEDDQVSPRAALDVGIGGLLGLLAGIALVVGRRRRPVPAPAHVPAAVVSGPASPPPAPAPSIALEVEERLQERVAAVTARELALARRAAELALKKRELEAPEPESEPEPEPEPEPEQEPEPEPEPEQDEPFVAPAADAWTIGAIERLMAEQGPLFPEQREELGFYLGALREVAEPGGRLPAGAHALFHDVFADLIAAAEKR
jgi:capsular polysaccharide biosynthesis protein